MIEHLTCSNRGKDNDNEIVKTIQQWSNANIDGFEIQQRYPFVANGNATHWIALENTGPKTTAIRDAHFMFRTLFWHFTIGLHAGRLFQARFSVTSHVHVPQWHVCLYVNVICCMYDWIRTEFIGIRSCMFTSIMCKIQRNFHGAIKTGDKIYWLMPAECVLFCVQRLSTSPHKCSPFRIGSMYRFLVPMCVPIRDYMSTNPHIFQWHDLSIH